MKAARAWWSRPGTHCHLVCAACCTAHTNQSTSAETSDISIPIDLGWGAVLEAVAVFQSLRCLWFGFRWIPIRAAVRNGWSSGQYLPALQEWVWWNARYVFLILLINNLKRELSKIIWELLETTDVFAASVNLTPWFFFIPWASSRTKILSLASKAAHASWGQKLKVGNSEGVLVLETVSWLVIPSHAAVSAKVFWLIIVFHTS